jgi:hypothetical protein
VLVSLDAKLYLRYAAVSMLGGVAATLGTIAVGLFGDYYQAHPYCNPIPLTGSLSIDVFGAAAPIFAGLLCAVLLLGLSRFPLKKFGVALAVSIVFGFSFSRLTAEGLAGYPMLFAVATAAATAALTFYPASHVSLPRKFFASTMLVLCCVPLSLLLVDLIYAPAFEKAIIGGKGLTDGILLSTLYSPFALTAIVSAAMYMSQTVLLIKKNRTGSKKPSSPAISLPSEQ